MMSAHSPGVEKTYKLLNNEGRQSRIKDNGQKMRSAPSRHQRQKAGNKKSKRRRKRRRRAIGTVSKERTEIGI
jgi:hypothetical protein